MKMNRSLSHLGLAMRAGKIVSGDESVMSAIRSGEAKAVIIATDASVQSKKKYTDKCTYYDIPLTEAFTRIELGASIGKDNRVVLAITDVGFAKLFWNSF